MRKELLQAILIFAGFTFCSLQSENFKLQLGAALAGTICIVSAAIIEKLKN